MTDKKVGVIVWADESKSTCELLGPYADVVGRDNLVDRVATLHFADGTSLQFEDAVGYYESARG